MKVEIIASVRDDDGTMIGCVNGNRKYDSNGIRKETACNPSSNDKNIVKDKTTDEILYSIGCIADEALKEIAGVYPRYEKILDLTVKVTRDDRCDYLGG